MLRLGVSLAATYLYLFAIAFALGYGHIRLPLFAPSDDNSFLVDVILSCSP